MDPAGGNAILPRGKGHTSWQAEMWLRTSPLRSIRAKASQAKVEYDPGTDPAAAAALAKSSDVAIVFAYQWESEGMDLPSLSLPHNQDALIAAVAAANPHTIVVLENGSPVTMPWADSVAGIVEAWYAGSRGAQAVTNILFGDVNPSAKLPVTFPKSDADLPHPEIVQPPPGGRTGDWRKVAAGLPGSPLHYTEGLKVGYKWYDAEHKAVLFPFGYGLSYTTYAYSDLKVIPGTPTRVSFTVANTGTRAGAEIAQVYAALPGNTGEPPKRLVGWSKVKLDAGESKHVEVEVDPLYLSIFSADQNRWQLVPGDYKLMVGGSSLELPLQQTVALK